MDHEEARRKNVGGKVLGFFYWKEFGGRTDVSKNLSEFGGRTVSKNSSELLFFLVGIEGFVKTGMCYVLENLGTMIWAVPAVNYYDLYACLVCLLNELRLMFLILPSQRKENDKYFPDIGFDSWVTNRSLLESCILPLFQSIWSIGFKFCSKVLTLSPFSSLNTPFSSLIPNTSFHFFLIPVSKFKTPSCSSIYINGSKIIYFKNTFHN